MKNPSAMAEREMLADPPNSLLPLGTQKRPTSTSPPSLRRVTVGQVRDNISLPLSPLRRPPSLPVSLRSSVSLPVSLRSGLVPLSLSLSAPASSLSTCLSPLRPPPSLPVSLCSGAHLEVAPARLFAHHLQLPGFQARRPAASPILIAGLPRCGSFPQLRPFSSGSEPLQSPPSRGAVQVRRNLPRHRRDSHEKLLRAEERDWSADDRCGGKARLSPCLSPLRPPPSLPLRSGLLPLSLSLSIASDDRVRNTFKKELALWETLRHPNIVQFLGVLNHPDRLIFLTEYLPNGSLFDMLRRKGRLDISTPVAYALHIARGMNYLHQHKPHAIVQGI